LVQWLSATLGPNYSVIYPLMHDPEIPEYPAWKEQLERELILLEPEIILIGHSLGGSVIVKLLSEEKVNNKITALFLIAVPFWQKHGDWEIDDFVLAEDFAEKIPSIPFIRLYHSTDDQWVPPEHMNVYLQKLPNATGHLLEGNDHEFKNGLPSLVDDIRNLNL
jgi:uncharacterized protein